MEKRLDDSLLIDRAFEWSPSEVRLLYQLFKAQAARYDLWMNPNTV